MDENTESVIAVVGHPIAGNPSQFAIEKAFQSMDLDWRVFSFDVAPENLTTAIKGLHVLGVRGVLLDNNLATHQLDQLGEDSQQSSPEALSRIDYYHRDAEGKLTGAECQVQTIVELVETQVASDSTPEEARLIFGTGDLIDGNLIDQFSKRGFRLEMLPSDLEQIPDAVGVLVGATGDQTVTLDTEEWPTTSADLPVFDLGGIGDEGLALVVKGYRLIASEVLWAHALGQCFSKWTGEQAPYDVLKDAIEEYLSV